MTNEKPAEIPASASNRVLVLAKEKASVRATTTFLNRRGFSVECAASLNDAVERMRSGEFSILLLSVDFPHAHLEMLPTFAKQKFNVEAILFAETCDRKATNRLSQIRGHHVIMGPISGPVVLMRIRQIQQESDAAKAAAEQPENTGGVSGQGHHDSTSDAIHIRSGREHDGAVLLKGMRPAESSYETTMAPSEKPPEGMILSSANAVKHEVTHLQMPTETREGLFADDELAQFAEAATAGKSQSQQKEKARPPFETKQASPPNRAAGFATRHASQTSRETNSAESSKTNGADASRSQGERGNAPAAPGAMNQKGQRAKLHLALPNEPLGKSRPPIHFQPLPGSDHRHGQNSLREKGPSQKTMLSPQTESPRAPLRQERPEFPEQRFEDSDWDTYERSLEYGEGVMMSCVREALTRVCAEPSPIEKPGCESLTCRFAAVLTVRSSEVSGSMICVIPYTEKFSGALFTDLEDEFVAGLCRANPYIRRDQVQLILLDDMKVAIEALLRAPWVLYSRSPQAEIAVSRLESRIPSPEIKILEDQMFKIGISEIRVDVPVSFDVFLYLPTNRKYLRYLKIGSRLSQRQVAKLVTEKITDFFLQESDLEVYRQYFATRALAESMNSLHN